MTTAHNKKAIINSGIRLNDLMAFHHIGVAVKSFAAAVRFYKKLGYTCSGPITDKLQNVKIIMCVSRIFPSIELIKPLNDHSPVSNYLKQGEAVFYHLGFEVKNLDKTIKAIEKHCRIFCVNEQKPALLFKRRKISFYYIPKIGLFEFIEK
jgi:methylmalonyl-CoA/ethylmalonyl-CoA epimerase